MKRVLYTSFIAVLVLLLSCQSNKTDDEYVPLPATIPEATPQAVPANSSALPVTPSLPAAVQTGAATTRPTINPEHGQPFHDCNVAVGAPLPQAANKVTPSQPGKVLPATQGLSPIQPVVPKTNPGVKLNPAHGQPGHRCEIAVGAPLS